MKENSKATIRRKYNIITGDGLEINSKDDPLNTESTSLDSIHYINDVSKPEDLNALRDSTLRFHFINIPLFLHTVENPIGILQAACDLLIDGGILMFMVPDEDLYELGHYPSIINPATKHTFSIFKQNSWSPVHINVLEMIQKLKDIKPYNITLIDTNYNYENTTDDQTWNFNDMVECFIEVILRK